MNLTARDRLVVVGKTGMGKSYWIKKLLSELMDQGHRIVVFDVCDEYSQQGDDSQETELGPLPQRCTVEELILDPPSWLDRDDLALSVVPEGDPEDVAEDFEAVSELIHHTGQMIFVVEETGFFGEHCESRIKTAATLYRKRGIAMVMCAQRAVQIPLTARSQASQIIAFRQDEVPDLNALALKINEEYAARVSRLRVGQFESWRDDSTDSPVVQKEN